MRSIVCSGGASTKVITGTHSQKDSSERFIERKMGRRLTQWVSLRLPGRLWLSGVGTGSQSMHGGLEATPRALEILVSLFAQPLLLSLSSLVHQSRHLIVSDPEWLQEWSWKDGTFH